MTIRLTHRLSLLVAVAAVGLLTTATAQAAITTEPNTPAGATAIANAIATNPAHVVGATFDAHPPLGGPNGTADAPFNVFPTNGGTFGILTSGNVQFADDPNTSGSTGANDGGGAVRGTSDRDVTILRIALNAPLGSNCLTFDFKFLSEEYPEYVGSTFNDAFIAELDTSTWTTTASTITAPNNFAFDSNGNVVSINSSGPTAMTAGQAAGTTYDGATTLLSASTQLTPGLHTLFLSIFDQGDNIYDSAVFLDNLRIGFVPNPAVNCAPGAQPVLFAMTLTPATDENPVGTPHTVTATLVDSGGTPVAGATIEFTVSGANNTTGSGVTNASGQATFTYTGTSTGLDAIAACYNADGIGSCEAVASAEKTWIIGPPATLTLAPPTDTNTAGDTHCVTATVKDQVGNPVPGVVVNFTVSGANTNGGAGVTDASGQAQFCYVGTVAGTDTITATAVGGSNPSATATKSWVPGRPATLVLTPATDTNTVDDQHCVTATVRDAFGNPTPGITVRFQVEGPGNTFGSAVTNTNGEATFCYTSALPGTDTITAYADTNNNSTQDAGEPSQSDWATKTWVLPASTEGCKVTYGGRITAANGDKATFGGNAKADGLSGQEEYQDHGPALNINVHSINVLAVVCSPDGTQASIFGTATVNGGGSFDYRIDLQDLGEPGSSDTYRIRLSNGYDSGEQVLNQGNVQIH